MGEITDIARHWSRQTDRGKGIRLEAEMLDLLNAIGVGELIRAAAFPPTLPDDPESRCHDCGRPTSHVYFIRAGQAIKIGVSGNVRDRLSALQIGHPDKLELMGSIAGTVVTEAAIHTAFAPDRLRGEWFRASPGLVAFIKGQCA